MNLIIIISFLMITLAAGYLLKASLSDMLPFVWCGLVLILYVLSFGRLLNLIDIILSAAALILMAAVLFGLPARGAVPSKKNAGVLVRERICQFGGYLKESIPSAGVVCYAVLCVILPLTLRMRTVTWWDDINYWAVDLKSLYYLGGFASRYTNVAPQFGDYPPAIQLAKWFTVHMDRSAFREDLAFVGYYLFNLSFMMPLFKKFRGKKCLLGIPIALITWAFAGIGEIYGYSGFCADLSMAYLFGSVLICAVEGKYRYGAMTGEGSRVTDDEQPSSQLVMRYIRPSMYLAVLVITKSTGFIWTFFGIVIWVVTYLLNMTNVTTNESGPSGPVKKGTAKNKDRGRKILQASGICILPVLTGSSWLLFCLKNHRVAQTTSTMVTYITTDDYGLSGYKSEFARAFLKGFFIEPLHLDHTWIDLSATCIFLLITVLMVLMHIKGILPGRQGRFVSVSLPLMGAVYYVVIFISHLTMFATETQYLESSAMAASIERYGSPFVIGSMLLLSFLWLNRSKEEVPEAEVKDGRVSPGEMTKLRIFIIFVIALTNIPAAFNGLVGYMKNEDVARAEEMRAGMIDEESGSFLQTIEESGITDRCISEGGLRICRVRDGAYYRVADTYVAYEASPVSVMAPSVKLSDIDGNTFVQMVNETHAGYLYVDEQPQVPAYLDEMVKTDDMAQSVSFEYNRIYRIGYEDGMMKLTMWK